MTAVGLTAERAGLATTIQDLGRPGHGRFGVAPSGACDPVAHRLANALAGNPGGAPALEITGPGALFRFDAAVTFALAGADLGATLDGVALPPVVGVFAAAGARLAFAARNRGARASLALAGGLVADAVLGSAATDLAGGLGPPALVDGARLTFGPALRTPRLAGPTLAALIAPLAPFIAPGPLRYVPEPGGGAPAEAHGALARATFRVSARSNRAGLRLTGAPLPTRADPDRLSEPTAPGAIQLPPDGLPLLLLADRNTTGGYPRLGHLASADRTRAAQLAPGDPVSFTAITRAEAVAAARALEAALAGVVAAISARV